MKQAFGGISCKRSCTWLGLITYDGESNGCGRAKQYAHHVAQICSNRALTSSTPEGSGFRLSGRTADTEGSCFTEAARISPCLTSSPQARRARPALVGISLDLSIPYICITLIPENAIPYFQTFFGLRAPPAALSFPAVNGKAFRAFGKA